MIFNEKRNEQTYFDVNNIHVKEMVSTLYLRKVGK